MAEVEVSDMGYMEAMSHVFEDLSLTVLLLLRKLKVL